MNNGVVGLDEGISQAVKTNNLLTTLLDSSSVKPLWLAQTLPISVSAKSGRLRICPVEQHIAKLSEAMSESHMGHLP
jgi:hypothetical protein